MNEASKTVTFIITAAVLGVAASSSYWMTQPADIVGFEKVGQEFFPEFQDATTARSLQVTAYDFDTDGLREFSVERVDGLWRIPSHHNYPAEAADRLARTATSLIGLERESIVARRITRHEEYGVVDPADTEADPDTAGQRITLRNEAGDILADYIIGKPAGIADEDQSKMVRDIGQPDDYYYVRVPDEKETYKARIQIDLSTRFSDWINPDLLKLAAADINRLEIDNYELSENDVIGENGQIQTRISKRVIDSQKLTRDGFSAWELDGLNPETEELNTLKVEEIVTLLDSMKIAGVRPKLKLDGQLLIKSDLTINEELARKNPQLFQSRVFQMQQDLERRGFTIGADEKDPTKIALMASRGELRAATKDGVLYTLYFGRSVSGDLSEIEIGGALAEPGNDTDSESSAADSADEPRQEDAVDQEESGDEPATENKSRYVAIRVDFDPTALGDRPVPPSEPETPVKPEGFDEWKLKQEELLKAKSNEDTDGIEPVENDDSADESDESPDPPADIEAANDEAFGKYDDAIIAHEQNLIQYSTDQEIFETAIAAYTTREKAGREIVEELNERFAEWFYVVPAKSLETLRLTHGDLVTIKEAEPPPATPSMTPGEFGESRQPMLPQAPNIQFPALSDESSKPANPPKETEDNPDTETSAEKGSAVDSEDPAEDRKDDSDSDSGDSREEGSADETGQGKKDGSPLGKWAGKNGINVS